MPTAAPPIDEIRANGLKISVWRNNVGGRASFAITLHRTYRLPADQRTNGDRGWRETQSLRREDLLLMAALVEKAYWRVVELEKAARNAKDGGAVAKESPAEDLSHEQS